MEAIETRYRTHSCGQLGASDVGKEVKLAGWVHSYRDHGGLVFIDLRDRDGLTQLVFDSDTCGHANHDESRKLRSEWVISISGTVAARAAAVVNPKLKTGQIEVRVRTLNVLTVSPTPPFTPHEHDSVNV
jgi:aspartyl-tRNA synthetase